VTPNVGMMIVMNSPAGWGPSHQTSKRKLRRPWWYQLSGYSVIAVLLVTGASVTVYAVLIGGWLIAVTAIERQVKQTAATARSDAAADLARSEDPGRAVRACCRQHGASPYLGADDQGELRFARSQRAVLLLGPPGPVSHCSIRVRHCANSPASDGRTWILRPFRRPAVTWTAWRSPRWT
jgi:hypothetical protein